MWNGQCQCQCQCISLARKKVCFAEQVEEQSTMFSSFTKSLNDLGKKVEQGVSNAAKSLREQVSRDCFFCSFSIFATNVV